MDITPIRTRAEHEAALEEVGRLTNMAPEAGTPEFDRMDVMTTLIATYEAREHFIGYPHPIDAIRERMRDAGMSQSELCLVTRVSASCPSRPTCRRSGASRRTARSGSGICS